LATVPSARSSIRLQALPGRALQPQQQTKCWCSSIAAYTILTFRAAAVTASSP
jgi:hypothetical protein